MRCEEFEERIHQSLDRRIAVGSQEALQRHAQRCPSCNGLLTSYEQLFDGLSFFDPDPLCEGFSRRVVQRVSGVRTRHRTLAVVAAVAAVAAVFLLAVMPLFLRTDAPEEVVFPGRSSSSQGEVTAGPAGATATTPSAGLTDGQDNVDIEQAHVFWGECASRLATNEWRPVDRITGEITGEFAPITEPLSIAIEEIRGAIPLGRSRGGDKSSSDSANAWHMRAVDRTA